MRVKSKRMLIALLICYAIVGACSTALGVTYTIIGETSRDSIITLASLLVAILSIMILIKLIKDGEDQGLL